VELQEVTVVSANDAWAVGFDFTNDFQNIEPIAIHWDGTQWTLADAPKSGSQSEFVSVTALSSDDVWATGAAATLTAFRPFAEHWDGSKWTKVHTPSPRTSNFSGITDVAAVSSTDVWGVGLTGQIFGDLSTLIEHWNGQKWTRVASPNQQGPATSAMQGIGIVSKDDIWAGGVTFNGANYGSLFEHWNGHKWAIKQ
jgi:hypothetical protein